MVINKVNINVYCNYNGTKRLNEKNPENTSYRKFWIMSESDLGWTWDDLNSFWSISGHHFGYMGKIGQDLRVFLSSAFRYWVSCESGSGQV